MNTGGRAYSDVLNRQECRALADAIAILLSHGFEDLLRLQEGETFDLTWMSLALPRRYLPKYTTEFARRFLVCVATVGWKLAQPRRYALECVAEELAAWAVLEQARECLDLAAEDAFYKEEEEEDVNDFGPNDPSTAFQDFEELLFEDFDALFLFDDDKDGIDASGVGAALKMAPLSFAQWFERFVPTTCVGLHPYYAYDPSRGAGSRAAQMQPVVGAAYQRLLNFQEQTALAVCMSLFIEETITDILSWRPGHQDQWRMTRLARYLPPATVPHLTPIIAQALLWSLSTVVWKLAQPFRLRLSSAAEEWAAWALLTRARAWLTEYHLQGHPAVGIRTLVQREGPQAFLALERVLLGEVKMRSVHEAEPGSGNAHIPAAVHGRLLPTDMHYWFASLPSKRGVHTPAIHPYVPDDTGG